ncbi:MAG: hypothetical protein NTU90_08480 [Proteobacteria bacterium]|nr:hypothetical protein [Pseudomonadota bacterium]
MNHLLKRRMKNYGYYVGKKIGSFARGSKNYGYYVGKKIGSFARGSTNRLINIRGSAYTILLKCDNRHIF